MLKFYVIYQLCMRLYEQSIEKNLHLAKVKTLIDEEVMTSDIQK